MARKKENAGTISKRDLGYWKGKAKGITKNFLKKHEEDWNDPYRE